MSAAPRSALGLLGGVFKEHGRFWGALYIVHQLLARATGGRVRLVPYAFVAQPIGPTAFASLRDDPKTAVRQVGPQDVLTERFPRPQAVNGSRWRSGAECYAVQVEGTFAGHLWLSRGFHSEDEVRCDYRLGQATVWDFDVYIAPAYRLGRTMARLWKGVNVALAEQRVAWTLSRISLFNRASLNAHQRLGAVRLSTAVFLVAGRLQLAFFTRSPFVHVSVRDGQRPVVDLRAPEPL